jgi:hypothetical protein
MKSRSSKNRHCILVVDANILIQDFWLEGSSWGFLLKREFLSHKLVIPRIALDEAASHIERRAADLLQRISQNGFTGRLEAQYQRLFSRVRRTKETPVALAKRCKKFMTSMVQRRQGLIAKLPVADLSTLQQRSISRTKPFNKGDKGFRDTLIWMNTVELVKDYHRVSFVSANTSDYAEGSGLHPDLEKDLCTVLPKNVHFRYFASLPEFIAFMDRDGDAGAEALRNALMSTGYAGFRLEDWVHDKIDDLLADCELDGVEWSALPYWAEDPRLSELEDLVGLEVHGERAIERDKIELFCDVSLIGVFQCSILYSSWEHVIHPMQVQWVDEDSSDVWTKVGVRAVGTFMLRLIFDLNSATVVKHDTTAVVHDIEGAKASLEELKGEFGGDG